MTSMRLYGDLMLVLALAGCGGKGRNPSTPKPAPAQPTVQVTITSPTINADLDQGDLHQATLAGSWSARNLGTAQVYLKLSDTRNAFVLPAAALAPAGGAFTFQLPLSAAVVAGNHAGTLSIRACRDAQCAQPYDGASASVSYRLGVSAIGDWETVGRNATRNPYVPITLDPARFAKAWEMDAPDTLVTHGDAVFALYAVHDGAGTWDYILRSFVESSATPRWQQTVSRLTIDSSFQARGSAAVGLTLWNGRLLAQVTGDERETRAYSLADGTLLERLAADPVDPWLAGQGDLLFAASRTATGGTTSMLRAFDATGQKRWELAVPLVTTAPAVDGAHVYHASQLGMNIIERGSGSLLATVPFPVNKYASVNPKIGSRGNVLVSLGYQSEETSALASLDVASRLWQWVVQDQYARAVTAAANGVVYAVPVLGRLHGATRPYPLVVEAFDEVTGAKLWSWTPPAPDPHFYAAGTSLVVTRNLLFVSGGSNTYAVDLATRQTVWQIPMAGVLRLSAGRMLYIQDGFKLTAVRLQ